MLRFWSSVSLLLLLLGALTCHAGEVLVMGDSTYRPVVYLDRFGRPSGLLVDMLRQYSRISGNPVTVRLYPWSRAYGSARDGEGGIIGLSKTEQREALFDYSAPLYDDDILVVVRADRTFAFDSLDDLRGKRIGVQQGASYGAEANAAMAHGTLEVVPDINARSRLLKVLYGRIDAAFIGNGKAGLESLLSADPELAASRGRFVVLERPLVHDTLYLGFAKSMGMREFLDDFNRVMEQIRLEKNQPE
ncbi:substrate-binding periplasmic protein [Pseudomonas sp. LRF_L74]|uniref:substrate-binding periplasmic protein n=1 Tax=Pseudomonas sp. LRF_L74 TaxID=3369422 RepID=UPI003F63B42E